jgi:hypothetical protein
MKRFEFICLICLLPLLAAVTGCTQNEMLTYENDPAVYFAGTGDAKVDSLNHSFFTLSIETLSDTVWVRVNTMGELSAQDRPVVLVQANAGAEGAAVAGVHYVALDDPDLKPLHSVPAGQEFGDMPVVLLRDESLSDGKVRLELTIAGNDHFRPGMSDKLKFTITTTDQVEKPPAWDTRWYYAFGTAWGPVKMRFLMSIIDADWNATPTDMSLLQFYAAFAKQKLLDYNAAHPDNPLKEANGDLVQINGLF